jgi:hypothetical protein
MFIETPQRRAHSDYLPETAKTKQNIHQQSTATDPIGHCPESQMPVWLRISDVQRIYSVGRGTVYNWLSRNLVVSVSLKHRAQIRGSRRIYGPSVDEFFASMAAKQMQDREGGTK